MLESAFTKPPIQDVDFSAFSKYGVKLKILRLDYIHKDLNGNKWFKLKRNIEIFKTINNPTVLSFGGAYSNHLRALSAAGKIFSFKTIGLIRGEIPRPLNPVLSFAECNGMTLHGISRGDYRLKNTKEFQQGLRKRFGKVFILPEGGSNQEALLGCMEISKYIKNKTANRLTYISMACGTGVTLAGIALGARSFHNTKILGVSVLKAPGYLAKEVKSYIEGYKLNFCNSEPTPWDIVDDYHCGGYAKTNSDLIDFCKNFIKETGVSIEPIYTGKLLFGLAKHVELGLISSGDEILAIHTGGVN
ncbi:MAG: pyridoxal-phosphate dependent enzyme [Gammaproteobacteria bacterium]|nr:pyridoxal-phosphate dependent enzyme [Gammaproteobacteria bacterium]